jgi:DNA invertase Pin-like site-specific DNA recombinase
MKFDAIYARQSVDKMDSISIESQIERCKVEAEGEYRVYKDKGYSGKNTDRPEFQQMLEEIRHGEIKRVIAYKLDRVSRSVIDFTSLIEEFQKYGVEFVSCTERFDTSTPMGRAMLNICVVFAQLERETIQQRVLDAYIARSRKGFFMGGKNPFGYNREPYIIEGIHTTRFVINEKEAEIVRYIYDLYSNPETSLRDVSKVLNAEGIKQGRRDDGYWSVAHLGEMLKSPVYVRADLDVYDFLKGQGAQMHSPAEYFVGTNGIYLFSERGAQRKQTCLQDQNIVLAPHEGIVSSDVWIKCRIKLLGNHQVAKPIKAKNTWLAGKIKCPLCGYAMVVRKAKTKVGRYFICSHHEDTIDGCPGVGGLHAAEIESIIYDEISEKLKEFETINENPTAAARQNPKITEIKLQIAGVEEEIDKLMKKLPDAEGVVMEYIAERIKVLDGQKKELSEKLKELEPLEMVNKDFDGLRNYMSHWDDLTIADKMTVVDAVINKISADQSSIVIDWKI